MGQRQAHPRSLPREADHGQVIDLLASLVSLFALILPVAGSVLVTQKILRSTGSRARAGAAAGSNAAALLIVVAVAAFAARIAWAWWPSGQYQPIRATQGGTIPGLVRLVSAPAAVARPSSSPPPVALAPGHHLAVAMIPVGGATRRHPALFIIAGRTATTRDRGAQHLDPDCRRGRVRAGGATSAIGFRQPRPDDHHDDDGRRPSTSPATPTTTSASSPATSTPTATPAPSGSTAQRPSRSNCRRLPARGHPGVGGGTKNGGVTYDVAYALVTVGTARRSPTPTARSRWRAATLARPSPSRSRSS